MTKMHCNNNKKFIRIYFSSVTLLWSKIIQLSQQITGSKWELKISKFIYGLYKGAQNLLILIKKYMFSSNCSM